jgi:hypothetical protein
MTARRVTSDLPDVSSPALKDILFFRNKISVYGSPISARSRGAFRDRHERWAGDAMDADGAPDESA